jgi:hypothetical protein
MSPPGLMAGAHTASAMMVQLLLALVNGASFPLDLVTTQILWLTSQLFSMDVCGPNQLNCF